VFMLLIQALSVHCTFFRNNDLRYFLTLNFGITMIDQKYIDASIDK
jgi:hypothetical protein